MSHAAVRAFLGSQGLGALAEWLDELPRRPRRAALVPTAGNPLPATPWVDEVAGQLRACGLRVEFLDVEGAQENHVESVLGRCELVFVTGGHPVFLLDHARRSGFARAVTRGVLGGGLAYAGMSAGASLAAADLAFYRGPDDPGSVESTEGLGLIGFFPLVHANRSWEGREERYARLIAGYGDRYRFVRIKDDEAVVVTGETWQTRRSPVAGRAGDQ